MARIEHAARFLPGGFFYLNPEKERKTKMLPNTDPKTGIRYGVISARSVDPEAIEFMDPDYGEPHCPHCGDELCPDWPNVDLDQVNECPSCGNELSMNDRDFLFPGSPVGYRDDDTGIILWYSEDLNAYYVLQSPVTTNARLCSPCCPGAGNLDEPTEGGFECYALPGEYFPDGKAPYPMRNATSEN